VAHVCSLLFLVAPAARDRWRMHSLCFAVDTCSCPLCSLSAGWIFPPAFPFSFSPPLGREMVVWALSPRCFRGWCQYPSEVPGGVTWGRFAHWVTWHCVRACAGSHAGVGLCSLISSDALRGHVTRGPWGFPVGGGRCTPLFREGLIRIPYRV